MSPAARVGIGAGVVLVGLALIVLAWLTWLNVAILAYSTDPEARDRARRRNEQLIRIMGALASVCFTAALLIAFWRTSFWPVIQSVNDAVRDALGGDAR